ncbi:MAG: M24 family metallopeptidase [Ilumatobacteraceae bacterium]
MTTTPSAATFSDRIERARGEMAKTGVDALLLSVGRDMPYLIGYDAMPLERLTALVVRRDGRCVLVVPGLEAPRVAHHAGVFELVAWGETQDPMSLVVDVLGDARSVAVGDQMWARFVLDGQKRLPHVQWSSASHVMVALRAVKDAAEIDALARAGAAADAVAAELLAGDIPLVGRTEAQVSADISARLLARGHDVVNFAIVAAGENAASPHHHPGSRVITHGDIVLCDFGGTMNGYCSDITRCVHIGEPPAEVREAWNVLRRAQQAAVDAARVGTSCEDVDRAARRIIADAGYGDAFIHRTGHGIGMDAHEDPYMVEGNDGVLAAGHAFSVEPGIYIAGKWGMRLEDIVVATDAGPRRMNDAPRELVVL